MRYPARHAIADAGQQAFRRALRTSYDFIVCGAGTSGSVVARRLAEGGDAQVLLLEAGGSDAHASVSEMARWSENFGTERIRACPAEPNPHLGGRRMPLAVGRVLGGGSSVNLAIWARGHRTDWDHFAAEAGDPGWSYDSVLSIYRRIEDWRGAPDPLRRGRGGLVHVEPLATANPVVPALLEAAASCGIPAFADMNGAMMEGPGGAALPNVAAEGGARRSIFRTYADPVMAQPNLTVLAGAQVRRLLFEGRRVTGVEFLLAGETVTVRSDRETILSLGALETPRLLMQSGIGDHDHLAAFGIEAVEHLPGVGCGYQDHVMIAGCVWELDRPAVVDGTGAGATFFWKSCPDLDTPDLQPFQYQMAMVGPELDAAALPQAWTLLPGLVRPQSRGRVRLTGAGPDDPVAIDTGMLSDVRDREALAMALDLCREIGNSAPLRPFARRELLPGALSGAARDAFIAANAVTSFHPACTARMGRDAMAVVDASLRVHGIAGLRVADASILPRVTTGATMAPCVVIGERAGEMLRREHGL